MVTVDWDAIADENGYDDPVMTDFSPETAQIQGPEITDVSGSQHCKHVGARNSIRIFLPTLFAEQNHVIDVCAWGHVNNRGCHTCLQYPPFRSHALPPVTMQWLV